MEDIIKPDEPDEQVANENSSPVFKKPADIASSDTFRRPRYVLYSEDRKLTALACKKVYPDQCNKQLKMQQRFTAGLIKLKTRQHFVNVG